MTDVVLDTLLEAVRFLLEAINMGQMNAETEDQLCDLCDKLDALIKLRHGRPADVPAK